MHRVYLVMWSLKLDPEDRQAVREIQTAKSAIERWCHPALYGRRMIGFVVITEESALELAKRVGGATANLSGLENVHVIAAPQPDDIACANAGTFGPLNHWTRVAWVEARKRNNAQNVRKPQWR